MRLIEGGVCEFFAQGGFHSVVASCRWEIGIELIESGDGGGGCSVVVLSR